MSNVLAKCAAIGLLGGGFALTGDLGWLADRGMRLVNARSIPSAEAPQFEPEAAAAVQPPAADPPVTAAANPPANAPVSPPAAAPGDQDGFHAAAEVAPPQAGRPPLPPADGPERIDLGQLRAGDRVVAWLAPPANAAASVRHPFISFDIVDPATGEAFIHRGGAAPRRVVVRGDSAASSILERGGTMGIVTLGVAHAAAGAAGPEILGPITALSAGR